MSIVSRSSVSSLFSSSTTNVNRIQSLSPTPTAAASTYTGGSNMHSHYRVPRSPSVSRRVASSSSGSAPATGMTRARTVTDLSYDARQARREERRTMISGRASPGPTSRFTGSSAPSTTSQTMPSRLRPYNSWLGTIFWTTQSHPTPPRPMRPTTLGV